MMRRITKPKHSVWTFFGIFLLLFVCSLVKYGIPFGSVQPYDANGYMELSESFLEGGSFSLLHYPNTIRGYLFPLMLCLVRMLLPFADGNLCVLLMNCAAFSAFLTWTVKRFWPSHAKRFVPYAVFIALLLIFWADLLPYALTDFYAFWWLLLAAMIWERRRLSSAAPSEKLPAGFLCGLLAYAAYNLRPNLSFALALLFLWMLVGLVRQPRRFGLFFGAVMLGMFIAALRKC